MKAHYLLYATLILLLINSCKKNNIEKPAINTTTGNNGGKPTQTLPTSPAQLLGFKINGASCTFDSTTNAYYYPVSAGVSLSGYTVSFDTTAAKAILIGNVKLKAGAVANYALITNLQVDIKALNSLNVATTYKLIITGLPIVTLQAASAIGDNQISAAFNLVNPDYQAQGSKLEMSSNIMINIRGATSRYYPKSSYAVHLVDGTGADTDAPLLGLRNDNSWILDAMYIDQSRMRNRLTTDIWNSFNNVPYIASEPTAHNGTRGYMTEVFLNNKYVGIYCLTEKVDRKQLQVKKQYGDIYKANDWTNQTDFYNVAPFDNKLDTWGGWELEYPDLGDTPAPDWSYLYNIVNFISTSSDDEFSSQIKSKVDINNMVDYFIFMNITEAFDNQNKNTFFSFYDYRTAGAFFYSVWDLDGSMGRNAGGFYKANDILEAGNNNLLQRLIKLNPENFKGLIKARWNSLKNSQLSKATVSARIEAYRKMLVNTNAFARERYRWANVMQDLDPEAAYMTSWYTDQYNMVDSYINSL
ncbi:MAG: CotH kinase family protein [Bacteroidota bacterium]